MRRFISILILLAMSCTLLCACNKSTAEATTSETLSVVNLLGPRYELWKTNRSIALYETATDDVVIESYAGITADGRNYSSRFMNVLNTYRSAEVVYITSETTETHYEYYDVDSDLLFVAVTTAIDNGDNTQSFEVYKYLVSNGTDVYLYDSVNETYTPVESSTVECLTYNDVIVNYGG